MNRLTKYSKFTPTNKSHFVKDFADIVVRKVINNYRLPDEFVTDKSTIFVFRFFTTFTAKLGINSKLSIIFHPQTDRQTKRFNQCHSVAGGQYCCSAKDAGLS